MRAVLLVSLVCCACGSRTALSLDDVSPSGGGSPGGGGKPGTSTPPGGSRPMHVAAGERATCVTKGGEVWCFGQNDAGQLGRGSVSKPGSLDAPVAKVPGLEHVVAVASGGGPSHFCALIEDGHVYCWGDNLAGQAGPPSSATTCREDNPCVPCEPSPNLIPQVENAVQIVLSAGTSCARLSDGRITCWGQHADLTGPSDSATWLKTITDAKDLLLNLAALSSHDVCVLHATGRVECDPQMDLYFTIPPNDDVIRLYSGGLAGEHSICTLSRAGRISCAYDRYYGQPRVFQPVESGAMGVSGACAWFESGKVRCWLSDAGFPLGVQPPCPGDEQQQGPMPPCAAQAREATALQSVDELQVGAPSCAVSKGSLSCWEFDNWAFRMDTSFHHVAGPWEN